MTFCSKVLSFVCLGLFFIVCLRVYIQSPFWLHVPGILATLLNPIADFQSIQWNNLQLTRDSSSDPNIIFIVADDLGYNDLSYGNGGVATPFIDSIAKTGVRFTVAYSGHATCAPSRAAIYTGRYPSRFGFEFTPIPMVFSWALSRPTKESMIQPVFHGGQLGLVPSMQNMAVPTSEMMISDIVKSLNYSTIFIGKWHLGESQGHRPQDRSYDETLAFLKGASLYYPLDHPSVITARVGGRLDDVLLANLRNTIQFNGGQHFQPNEYMTDYLANQGRSVFNSFCAISYLISSSLFYYLVDFLSHLKPPRLSERTRRLLSS